MLLGLSAMRASLPYKDIDSPAGGPGVSLGPDCITGEARRTQQEDGDDCEEARCRDYAAQLAYPQCGVSDQPRSIPIRQH